MAQKLDADLNIIQNSDIEVQIDPITADLDIIQKLDDEPNDVGGLSAQQLKAKFDEAGNIIKEFINDSLIPQVTAETVSEEQRELNEQQRQDNEAQRQANEQVRQANETERETAEVSRSVWEDYDPAKAYVPGNKVYWAGSSYVNKAPCTGVPPNVAAYWQMVAKRGETVGDGMTEEDCDERYLQLSGGWMTGQMTVQEPELPNSPVPKWFVSPASISVTKLPDKTKYYDGDTFIPDGMEVAAKDINGRRWKVNNFTCQPNIVSANRTISVLYDRIHGEPLATYLPFDSTPALALPPVSAPLPGSSMWGIPIFHDGIVFLPPGSGAGSTNQAAYSEDYGKTWKPTTLPASQIWNLPVYDGGVLIIGPTPVSTSQTAAYSENGGKTWHLATLPLSKNWEIPVYGGGTWCWMHSTYQVFSNQFARSVDGGKTWHLITLPVSQHWGAFRFGNGQWVAMPGSNAVSNKAAYSEDGGNTWVLSILPLSAKWAYSIYSDGVFSLLPQGETAQTVYSEDGGKTWNTAALPLMQGWSYFSYTGCLFIHSQQSVAYAAYSEDGGKTWKPTTLPYNQYWAELVYDGNTSVIAPSFTVTTNHAAYSEDGGRTWKPSTLPVSQKWYPPVPGGGVWIMPAYDDNASDQWARSEDGGKTWQLVTMPASKKWNKPVFEGGLWFSAPRSSSNEIAYSEDRGKTWQLVTMPNTQLWRNPIYTTGIWVQTPNGSGDAAYSRGVYTLAPLPGEAPNPVGALPPSPEDQINALIAENAALAAAIERGLSL